MIMTVLILFVPSASDEVWEQADKGKVKQAMLNKVTCKAVVLKG